MILLSQKTPGEENGMTHIFVVKTNDHFTFLNT